MTVKMVISIQIFTYDYVLELMTVLAEISLLLEDIYMMIRKRVNAYAPTLARLAPACILLYNCLLYTSPSPRDRTRSRMPSSA